MPPHKAATTRERYDQALHYARDDRLPAKASRPLPTSHWPEENVELLEHYHKWLLQGGACEYSTNIIYLPIAGHVLGLNLKPHGTINLEEDLKRAMEYVQAKGVGEDWLKACRNGLNKFRRFLRLERGLGEECKVKPFDSARVTVGLPIWLVNELERYQHIMQRNWRDARMGQNIRCFWSGYLRMWRFFVEQYNVKELKDLKRQHMLDYVDHRLDEGHAVSGVNKDLRNLHTFLLFLQDEGYTVPQSLLRIPGLKRPDSLPKYLTDEQVRKLRDEMERRVREAGLASHRRLALLMRAAFYLLWQGGLRAGEVEELRLEDLDISTSLNAGLAQKRLSVRDGKGKKDRTVYLTDTAIRVLQEYLAVRGEGSTDHVFLYRNAPLKKDILRAQLKYAGERVDVKVYPHRLRHTCATQLLNAGCRVTSIQRFLGHKELGSTMIYARTHDQTVADDYFAAMQRVEQRLQLSKEKKDEVVKVQEYAQLLVWLERLAAPELCQKERLDIAESLKQALLLGVANENTSLEDTKMQTFL